MQITEVVCAGLFRGVAPTGVSSNGVGAAASPTTRSFSSTPTPAYGLGEVACVQARGATCGRSGRRRSGVVGEDHLDLMARQEGTRARRRRGVEGRDERHCGIRRQGARDAGTLSAARAATGSAQLRSRSARRMTWPRSAREGWKWGHGRSGEGGKRRFGARHAGVKAVRRQRPGREAARRRIWMADGKQAMLHLAMGVQSRVVEQTLPATTRWDGRWRRSIGVPLGRRKHPQPRSR